MIAHPVYSREKTHRPTGSKCKSASSFRLIRCSNSGTSAARLRRRYVRSPSSRRALNALLGSGSPEKCHWRRHLRIGASAGCFIWVSSAFYCRTTITPSMRCFGTRLKRRMQLLSVHWRSRHAVRWWKCRRSLIWTTTTGSLSRSCCWIIRCCGHCCPRRMKTHFYLRIATSRGDLLGYQCFERPPT